MVTGLEVSLDGSLTLLLVSGFDFLCEIVVCSAEAWIGFEQ
jgi:hypothetical protein